MRHKIKPGKDFRFVFVDLRWWFAVLWLTLTVFLTALIVRSSWNWLCESGHNNIGVIFYIFMLCSLLASVLSFIIYDCTRKAIKKKWKQTHSYCIRPSLRIERKERRETYIDDISGYISQGRDPHIMRSINYYYIYMLEK